MPIYRITAPNGKSYQIEGPPGASDAEVAQAVLAQNPEAGAKPPETTAFGQVKEGFKGIVPGAVGLLESAATGASALLPEDMEKSAREKIKSVATAAKAPFAAGAGYEDSVGRKLGEAVGSTVPFLAAGPLGLAGRAAAVGLGVGAGAGESRTRAEEAGATGEQRSTATALGIIPGALEAFAPLRILSRIPTASKAAGVEAVKRALVAGGEEAAQEAASGFAQNLIAKGVYKPEQALIEGLGEQAAYGGATGAIVQGLMDMALGRRARGAKTTQEEAPPATQPGAQLPPEAPVGTQGTLFTPEEMGKPVAAPKEELTPPAEGVPEGQQDLGLDFQREYADMAQERERLKQVDQTPEVKARIAELGEQMALYTQSDIESMRAEKETQAAAAAEDAKARKKFPALTEAPDLMTASDEVKARTQGELFAGEDLGTPPESGAPVAEPTLRPAKEKAPLQYKLPLRSVREGRTPNREFPMPEQAAPLTMQDVLDVNIPLRKGMQPWFEQNVVGKTIPEVQALVKRTPKLVEGPSQQAKILRELLAPQPAPFKEAPRVKPTPTETPAVEQRVEPGASEPSVGVPSEPAPAELAEPGAGVPTTAEAPVTPDGLGLVPAGRPAVQRDETAVGEPTAVETETPEQEAARKQEAEDFKRRMETVDVAKPKAPTPAPIAPRAPATKAEAPAEAPVSRKSPFDISGPSILSKEKTGKGTRYSVEPGGAAQAPATKEQLQIVQELTGKNLLEVAVWASTKSPDADQRLIASRIAATLKELQSVGVTLGQLKITPEGQSLTSGARGVTVMQPGPNNGPSTIRITLNHPSNGAQSGIGYDVILHELVHAATIGAIRSGNKQAAAHTRLSKAVVDLYAVARAVIAHVDAKHARGETLNSVEQKFRTNYMRDVDEILAWTMTDRSMQQYMETIPYKGSNLWTRFVESVRNMLGLTAKADTALSEILRVGGELTSVTAAELSEVSKATGLQFSKTYTSEDVVSSMGELTPTQERGLLGLIKGVKTEGEPRRGVKFRVAVADSAAAIEDKFSGHFNGAVRDSLGKLNPMGLYRQAQDYSKLLLEYFQGGTLAKDVDTGQYRVTGDSKTGAPMDVFKLVQAWGKKTGRSPERAEQFASRVIEAHRLEQVLKTNPDFPKHIKDADRALLVAEYNADPAFAAMNAAMDKPRVELIKQMVKVGRLSAEMGAEWSSVVGYVPFDRIDDFSERFSMVKKTSGRAPLMLTKDPELKGSFDRPVGNVFENYLNTMGWMVGQVINNDARVQSLRSLEDLGYAGKPSRVPGTKNRTAKAYVKGELRYWDLPSSYDAAAFQELNPPKAKWLQVLGQASNVLRKAVTILPPFALKQVTDDVQRAIMTSGVKNPGALLRMTLSNFGGLALAELRGIQHPTVREFGALGLTGEYDFQQGKPATSVLKDLGYRPRGKFETLMHRLDGITRASDLAVRKAIYDQTLKETQGDALLAQTRAREFINFRRRGASQFVGDMVATIPFFNAYIQGMDVLYRAASGKDSSSSVGRAQARRMFWSRASVVMMLSSLYALGAGDDEDYQEMDLRTRDSNWILPGGFKLPVPSELGALFKVVPERVVEYMRRQGTPEEQTAWEATRTALTYIFEQYVGRTVPVPQGVKPLLEAWTNYSFFTGRELEGIYQKQQDPSLRRASNTSELAIAISEFSRDIVGVDKVSPIMIDNALNGYFGSSAGLLVAMTDSLLNPTRVDRPLHKWALVSNYMYDPVGTRRMTEFYESREKVGRANTTLNELMKTDLDKAAAYAEEHADELMLESAVNSTLEQLERTRAYKKYLNSPLGAEDMPKEEREAAIKEIREMEIGLTGWLREAKTSMRQ